MEKSKFLEPGYDFSTASDAELRQFARQHEAIFVAYQQAMKELSNRNATKHRGERVVAYARFGNESQLKRED